MKIESLKDLFHHELKDLFSAEDQITDSLPKMIDAVGDDELRRALEEHLALTRAQRDRIEQIADDLGWGPRGHKCAGMEGIIEEGEELLKEDVPAEVLDAAIIGAAQRIEHYEIAAYGTARTHAEQLGLHDAVDLLQTTLKEEKEADQTLTRLAERKVNVQAITD